jgi:hypothetical protein
MERKTYRVRVKYCGGCNPEIDRGGVVKELEAQIRSGGDDVVIVTGEGDADLLLLVQGCARACLEEDHPELKTGGPFVSIQGARLDLQPVSEAELPGRVRRKIEAALSDSRHL